MYCIAAVPAPVPVPVLYVATYWWGGWLAGACMQQEKENERVREWRHAFPLGFWKVLEVQFSKSKHLVLQHVLAVLRLQSMIAECHPLDRRFLFVRRRRHLLTVTRCQCPIRCIWWAKMERNGTEQNEDYADLTPRQRIDELQLNSAKLQILERIRKVWPWKRVILLSITLSLFGVFGGGDCWCFAE